MGGGEGSTARELLRYKAVEKVVMCDIDEVKILLHLCNICLYIVILTVLISSILRCVGFSYPPKVHLASFPGKITHFLARESEIFMLSCCSSIHDTVM